MSAFEWFESIETEGKRIQKVKQDLAMLESRIAPHAQGFEPMGHGGGSSDAMLGMAMASARLGALKRLLPTLERKHEAKLAYATDVLYGRSGRGGLARAASTDDADMLCFHYLQGESWASIARRFDPDTSNLTVWCKNRAKRACRQIDRIGMDTLADS